MGKTLDTKAEICEYINFGWQRIEIFIKQYKFPARKLGGRWISDTDLIDEWKREYIKESSFMKNQL